MKLRSGFNWLKRHPVVIFLGCVTAVGAYLRFYHIDTESIWFDEAASIYSAKRPIIDMLKDCVTWHRHPPVHFAALKIWILIFGDGEAAVRSLSAIFGTASIPVIYLVGAQLFNKKTGLLAGVLLSVSWFAIYYSQETRAYSMLLFFTLLSFYLYISLLNAPHAGKWRYISYFAANTLLIYTHYYGLFVVAGQLFYFLLFRKHFYVNTRYFWNAQAATAVAFFPWATVFVKYSIPNSFSWARPGLSQIISTLAQYSGYHSVKMWLLILFGLLYAAGIFHLVKKAGSANIRLRNTLLLHSIPFETLMLLLVWLSFPIIVPFIISQLPFSFTGIYSIRYTISAVPAFYLLIGKGLEGFLHDHRFYPVFFVSLLLIMLLSFTGLRSYYSTVDKEQWREAIEFVQPLLSSDDVIVSSNVSFPLAIAHYYKGNVDIVVLEDNEAAGLETLVSGGKHRMWLFQGAWGSVTTKEYMMETLEEHPLIMEKEFYRVQILLFELQ